MSIRWSAARAVSVFRWSRLLPFHGGPLLAALACGDPEGVPDTLEQACRQLIACESVPVTAQRIEECRQDLSNEYEEAATLGCADEYTGLVECYAIVPLVCSMQGPGSCEAARDALENCREPQQDTE